MNFAAFFHRLGVFFIVNVYLFFTTSLSGGNVVTIGPLYMIFSFPQISMSWLYRFLGRLRVLFHLINSSTCRGHFHRSLQAP